MTSTISAAFPFESKFLEVKGSNMHYIDEGSGDTLLFLHGNPTSNYLWRNIIPHLNGRYRCIAPDLIGMGKSDKPKIDYLFDTHYTYLEAFIKKLELKNITLVIHDWGSGLGFHYARLHADNIKAIAFMEAVWKPMEWKELPSDFRMGFRMMRAPLIGYLMTTVGNVFVEKLLPQAIVRPLTKEEHVYYRKPYPSISSRKPLGVWPKEIPINGTPKRMFDHVSAYHQWLQETQIPKLCLYAHPGGIIGKVDVAQIEKTLPNIQMVDVGKGVHFLQEDNPDGIGLAIAAWRDAL